MPGKGPWCGKASLKTLSVKHMGFWDGTKVHPIEIHLVGKIMNI